MQSSAGRRDTRNSLRIIQIIQAALKDIYKNTVTTRELADQSQQLASRDHDSSCNSTPEHRMCHVKFPKLSIKRFGGALTKWMTYWDAFDAAVHSNPTYPILKCLIISCSTVYCSRSSDRSESH